MQVSGYGNNTNQSSYGAGQVSTSNYAEAASSAEASSAEAPVDSSGEMGYQDGYSLDISPEAWASYRGG